MNPKPRKDMVTRWLSLILGSDPVPPSVPTPAVPDSQPTIPPALPALPYPRAFASSSLCPARLSPVSTQLVPISSFRSQVLRAACTDRPAKGHPSMPGVLPLLLDALHTGEHYMLSSLLVTRSSLTPLLECKTTNTYRLRTQ